MLSPIVWTTMATGVGPDVHRVLDFQELDRKSGERVPISGLSRAAPAVWNVASAAERKVGVAGWWATHPAEVVRGFFLSDRASPILFDAPPSGSAYPPALEARVRSAVEKDARPSLEELRWFVRLPDDEIARGLSSADGMRNPVFALARILGSTRVYQRLARDLYDRERPDFMTVYFEGPDEIGHVFAADASPALPCISPKDAAAFGSTAALYYGAIDAILGQWMRRAREDGATLLVTSDHGFKWGDDRPCERSSSEGNTAAFWHRPDGVFAAWGTRVIPGRDREHPGVFDVAPTVLSLLGLPAEARMPGHALRAAFREEPALAPTRSSETLRVDRVAAAPMPAAEAREDARKLVALGYLSARDVSADTPSAGTGERPGMTEGAWNNLGLYERETKKDLRAAEGDFRRALALRPGYASPLFNLAVLYRSEGKRALARDLLFRAIDAGHPDPSGTLLHWAAEERTAKRSADEIALLDRAAARFPGDERIARTLADGRFRAGDCAGAAAALRPFQERASAAETWNGLGLYATCLGRPDEAASFFRRSLAIRPGQPGVIDALKSLGR